MRNPKSPRLLTSVRTDCGSHTHTVLPEANRLIVYVQSYDVAAGRYRCDGAHDKISVVEVPKPGGTQRATTGCHDITVYQKIGLAAGACTGEGAIIDIKDPVNPKVIASVEDPNSRSGTAPRSARTARRSCSPTSSAAAASVFSGADQSRVRTLNAQTQF